MLLLPLSIGEYAQYWKQAQNICVKLMEHSNPAIRAWNLASKHDMEKIVKGELPL